MNDGMIVSRMIIDATCGPEMLALLRQANPGLEADRQVVLCVFQTTVSRGARTARVLCCLSGGRFAPNGQPELTMVGQAALDALMRLPACMDDRLAEKGTLAFQELRIGPTPLRDKVIDALLEAPPGARYCFFGDLAGELNGKTFETFNVTEPLYADPSNAKL